MHLYGQLSQKKYGNSMLEKLSMKLITIGLAIVLVLGALYWIYSSIYDSGYRSAQVECDKKFAQLQKETDERLANLQAGLQVLSGNLGSQQNAIRGDMAKILTTIRQQPIIISKNGKCEPSPEFVDSINKAILRANQK